MHELLKDLIKDFEITGNVGDDAINLLKKYGYDDIATHTLRVADWARKIADIFNVDEKSANTAALLHDLGNIVPVDQRVGLCESLGIEVYEEERKAPSILHQKISKAIACEVFKANEVICNAIECHTTLKTYASKLDLVLLVSDKMSWDSAHNENFIEAMKKELENSLEAAAFEYLRHICIGNAAVLHPWTLEAYRYLERISERKTGIGNAN